MEKQEYGSVITEVEHVLLKTVKTKLQHLAEENEESYTIYGMLPSLRHNHNEDYDP